MGMLQVEEDAARRTLQACPTAACCPVQDRGKSTITAKQGNRLVTSVRHPRSADYYAGEKVEGLHLEIRTQLTMTRR
jgi:hypothetical protein